jgi:hypothetical protein
MDHVPEPIDPGTMVGPPKLPEKVRMRNGPAVSIEEKLEAPGQPKYQPVCRHAPQHNIDPQFPKAQLHRSTRLSLLALKEPPHTKKLQIIAGERLGETVIRSRVNGSQKRPRVAIATRQRSGARGPDCVSWARVLPGSGTASRPSTIQSARYAVASQPQGPGIRRI